jgi:flavin reductase (DIM6/NTAB) family NADH-FMN oxidoreductase RutF
MSPEEFIDAVSRFSTGVTIVSANDDRDDVATVVSSFASASLEPPLVVISVAEASYMHEVLGRQPLWAVSVLGAHQRQLAGRLSAPGRPSPRLLLADTPHYRGPQSGALILEGGLTALECRTTALVPVGDHALVVGEVLSVAYVSYNRTPLVRYAHAYRSIS